VTQQMVTP